MVTEFLFGMKNSGTSSSNGYTTLRIQLMLLNCTFNIV